MAGQGPLDAIETASTQSEEDQASDGQRFHKQGRVAKAERMRKKPERNGGERKQRSAHDQQQSRLDNLHVQLPFAVEKKDSLERQSSTARAVAEPVHAATRALQVEQVHGRERSDDRRGL